jgi:hypothetical protein
MLPVMVEEEDFVVDMMKFHGELAKVIDIEHFTSCCMQLSSGNNVETLYMCYHTYRYT